jgi:hypothetical protein
LTKGNVVVPPDELDSVGPVDREEARVYATRSEIERQE